MISDKSLDYILFDLETTEKRNKPNIEISDSNSLDLIDEVDVKEQGIYIMSARYSQTFKHKPNPNLALYKNSRFRSVGPHIHPWVELGYMYSGSISHTIRDYTHRLSKGQVFILDSETPHSLGYAGENDILISVLLSKAYFTHNFFNHFSHESILSQFLINAISEKTSHDAYIVFNTENSSRIPMFMNELMKEHISPSTNSSDIIDNLINLIFLELINEYDNIYYSKQVKRGKSNIAPILKYIESNFKTCRLEELSKIFNMNPNYLTTLLKETTGYSFKELVQKQRFQYIISLLNHTEKSIEEICFEAGYKNSTYFYKKFKEIYGCTPNEYRNKYDYKENDRNLERKIPKFGN